MEKDKQNLIDKYNSIADKVSENKFWVGYASGLFHGSILQFNISGLCEPMIVLSEPATIFLPVATLIGKLISFGVTPIKEREIANLKEKINLESKEIVKSSIGNLSEEEIKILKTVLSNKDLLELVCLISENNLADEVLNSDMNYKDNAEENNKEQHYSYSERARHKNKRNK